MVKEKQKDMKIPDIKKISIDAWQQSCPYCGKELEAVYIKQLNAQYLSHTATCKERR